MSEPFPQVWFDGVTLLGQFDELRTGCWLLSHGEAAAILEVPPRDSRENSPADVAESAVRDAGLRVTAILCTHAHGDHFDTCTLADMRRTFPAVTVCRFTPTTDGRASTGRRCWRKRGSTERCGDTHERATSVDAAHYRIPRR